MLQLARMIQENADIFIASLLADLGKPKMESVLGEVGVTIDRAMVCAEKLEEWTKPEVVEVPKWQKPWNPTIHRVAKGTVLIIS